MICLQLANIGQYIGVALAVSTHCSVQRLERFTLYPTITLDQRWSTGATLITPATTSTSHIALPCLLTLCPLSDCSYCFARLRGRVTFAEITGKVYAIELK